MFPRKLFTFPTSWFLSFRRINFFRKSNIMYILHMLKCKIVRDDLRKLPIFVRMFWCEDWGLRSGCDCSDNSSNYDTRDGEYVRGKMRLLTSEFQEDGLRPLQQMGVQWNTDIAANSRNKNHDIDKIFLFCREVKSIKSESLSESSKETISINA